MSCYGFRGSGAQKRPEPPAQKTRRRRAEWCRKKKTNLRNKICMFLSVWKEDSLSVAEAMRSGRRTRTSSPVAITEEGSAAFLCLASAPKPRQFQFPLDSPPGAIRTKCSGVPLSIMSCNWRATMLSMKSIRVHAAKAPGFGTLSEAGGTSSIRRGHAVAVSLVTSTSEIELCGSSSW